MDKIMPKCWKESSKPHLFCPGCGHGSVLKQLGHLIDEMGIARNTVFGIDIGCSLLAWDFFDIDTIQTHHGRTTSVMVGYKMARPSRIAIAYMGDGGGYAIGLQALIHAAYRNNPITVILVNNENYAMTGGQTSPTTQVGTVTSTAPSGKNAIFGSGFKGPELLSESANKKSYIARASMSNPIQMKAMIKRAIDNQVKNNSFSFLEILSICPTNWKTNAKESLERLNTMEKFFPIGEINSTSKEMK